MCYATVDVVPLTEGGYLSEIILRCVLRKKSDPFPWKLQTIQYRGGLRYSDFGTSILGRKLTAARPQLFFFGGSTARTNVIAMVYLAVDRFRFASWKSQRSDDLPPLPWSEDFVHDTTTSDLLICHNGSEL